MSWTSLSHALGPGRAHDPEPGWSRWMCDCCSNSFDTLEVRPARTRRPDVWHCHAIYWHDPRTSTRPNVVHYCRDPWCLSECDEGDARQVEEALSVEAGW